MVLKKENNMQRKDTQERDFDLRRLLTLGIISHQKLDRVELQRFGVRQVIFE